MPLLLEEQYPAFSDRITKAREAGYDDIEISDALNGRIQKARDAGYSDDEIMSRLGSPVSSQPQESPTEEPFPYHPEAQPQGNDREKGIGFLGELKRPDGGVSTELSASTNVDGTDIEYPLLVPTLEQGEIDSLLRGEKPTKEVYDKAIKHAMGRMKEGKSPFYHYEQDHPQSELTPEQEPPTNVNTELVKQATGTTLDNMQTILSKGAEQRLQQLTGGNEKLMSIARAPGEGLKRLPYRTAEMIGNSIAALGNEDFERPDLSHQYSFSALGASIAHGLQEPEVTKSAEKLAKKSGEVLEGELKLSPDIQEDFIARGVANGVEMLGPMAAAVIPSIVTGTPLAAIPTTMALFGLSTYKDTKDTLIEAGVPEESAINTAILHGISEGGIESIATVVELMTIGLGKPAVKAVKESAKAGVKKLLKTIGKVYGEEYAEEVVQGASEKYLKSEYADNPKVQQIGWKEIFTEPIIPVAVAALTLGGASKALRGKTEEKPPPSTPKEKAEQSIEESERQKEQKRAERKAVGEQEIRDRVFVKTEKELKYTKEQIKAQEETEKAKELSEEFPTVPLGSLRGKAKGKSLTEEEQKTSGNIELVEGRKRPFSDPEKGEVVLKEETPKQTEEDHKALAKEAGVLYQGVYDMGGKRENEIGFQEPTTGADFNIPESQVTPERIREKAAEKGKDGTPITEEEYLGRIEALKETGRDKEFEEAYNKGLYRQKEEKAKPVQVKTETPNTTTEFNVGADNTYKISTPDGSSITGYLNNQDFPGEGEVATRGEVFYTEVKEQGKGLGFSLWKDAIRLMQANGATTVNTSQTTKAGRALADKLVREGVIEGPIKVSESGKEEYRITLGKKKDTTTPDTFLPSTEESPKSWRADGKLLRSLSSLIEPGVKQKSPTPFAQSIYELIGGSEATVDPKTGKMSAVKTGAVHAGADIIPNARGASGKGKYTVQELVDQYNQGNRWIDVKPDSVVVEAVGKKKTAPKDSRGRVKRGKKETSVSKTDKPMGDLVGDLVQSIEDGWGGERGSFSTKEKTPEQRKAIRASKKYSKDLIDKFFASGKRSAQLFKAFLKDNKVTENQARDIIMLTGRRFGDFGDIVRFIEESKIVEAENLRFVKYIKYNKEKLAVRDNSKTIISVDCSMNCPFRTGDKGSKLGGPCIYCYVDNARAAKKVGQTYRHGAGETQVLKYTDEILQMPDGLVDYFNEQGGLRMHAFSDYMPQFNKTYDKMFDHAKQKDLWIKAITKQKQFVDLYGDHPNIRINISVDELQKIGLSNAPTIATAHRWAGGRENVKLRSVATNKEEAIRHGKDSRISVVTLYHGATGDKLFELVKFNNPGLVRKFGADKLREALHTIQDMSGGTNLMKDMVEKFPEKICCQGGACQVDPVKCGFSGGAKKPSQQKKIFGKTSERGSFSTKKVGKPKRSTKAQREIIAWIKSHPVRMSGHAGFKNEVMKREGIDPRLFHTWTLPYDYAYARLRSNGYTHTQANKQLRNYGQKAVPDGKHGKQPWEMTKGEWKDVVKQRAGYTGLADHKKTVKQAISEGKNVPMEVLKDYPDLQRSTLTSDLKTLIGDPERGSFSTKKVDRGGENVDNRGMEKRVFHGTNAEFNDFDITKTGTTTDEGTSGRGFYFAGDKEFASIYGKNIKEVIINIENPYIHHSKGESLEEVFSKSGQELTDHLKKMGHDGVIADTDGMVEYVVFDKSQIKLKSPSTTTDNRGMEKHWELTRDKFDNKYFQHTDLRSKTPNKTAQSIMESGFESAFLNVIPVTTGSTRNTIDKKYGSKKGKHTYIVHRGDVDQKTGKIKKGWKPNPNDIVIPTYDNQPIHELVVRNALSRGELVPESVLVDYPWLKEERDAFKPTATVYHGGTGTIEKGRPTFFTQKQNDAEWYGGERGGDTPSIVKAEVTVKNPASWKDVERVAKKIGANEKDIQENSPYEGSNVLDYVYVPKVVEELKKQGFDGVIDSDALENTSIWVRIPFDESQVKVLDTIRGKPDPVEGVKWPKEQKPLSGDDQRGASLLASDLKTLLGDPERGSFSTKKVDKDILWHGSPSGNLSGTTKGIHVGTFKAATQALEARIGIPADGKGWDGTREYGKTLLAGKRTIKKLYPDGYHNTGFNSGVPSYDFYPLGKKQKARYSDGTLVPLDVKPIVSPMRIKGEMFNAADDPIEDTLANMIFGQEGKEGLVERRGEETRDLSNRPDEVGLYYRNDAEDVGSISAVVPHPSFLEDLKTLIGDSERGSFSLKGLSDKQKEAMKRIAVHGERMKGEWKKVARAGFSFRDFLRDIGKLTGKQARVVIDAVREEYGIERTAKLDDVEEMYDLAEVDEDRYLVEEYEKWKDVWLADKDELGKLEPAIQKRELQKEIIRHFGERRKSGKGKLRYRQKARDIDQAIEIYIDTKRDPRHIKKYYDNENLTDEQRRIIDLSQNLPEAAQKVADKIESIYKQLGEKYTPKDNKDRDAIIHNLLTNYASRLWHVPKNKRGEFDRFRKTTGHDKSRVFVTVIQGWASGFKLKARGATTNLERYQQEMAYTLADKRLIEALKKVKTIDGEPLLSTKEFDGSRKIDHPNFVTWELSGKIEKGKIFKSGQDTFVTEDGDVYIRKDLYAPEKQAKNLNNILGRSKIEDMPGVHTITKYNAIFKSWILQSSLFHHQAFLRSYYFGTNKKTWEEMDFRKAYKEGLSHIEGATPLARLAIRNGLTFGLRQDWEEDLLREGTAIGEFIDKYEAPKKVRDTIMQWRQMQTDFLFGELGAGLKMKSFEVELRNQQKEYPDADVNVLAKRVADLINDDFGGLHLQRMGRSPTLQHVFRVFALAPDWTESNVRTMVKTVWTGSDHEKRKFFQKFWGGILYKGAVLTLLSNFLLAGGDWDEFLENYKTAWEAGNLKWMGTDVTPVYKLLGSDTKERHYFTPIGHFRDVFKFILHPIRSARHKSSVVGKMAMEMAEGVDWAGRRFTTFPEFLGFDDKGVYKTNRKGKWKKGDPKGGKLRGKTVTWGGKGGSLDHSQVPSFLLAQMRGTQPVQVQNLISWWLGEMDGITAVLNGMGFGISQTYGHGEDKKKAPSVSTSRDRRGRTRRTRSKRSSR